MCPLTSTPCWLPSRPSAPTLVAQDGAAVRAAVHKQYVFTAPVGPVLSGEQRAQFVEQGRVQLADLSYSELTVGVGPAAVVTGRYDETRPDGTRTAGRLTTTFIRTGAAGNRLAYSNVPLGS